MNNPLKVTVNGLACTAYPVGGGLYAAAPDNIGDFLSALFSGKLFNGLDVKFANTYEDVQPEEETITQYRHRTGLSRTQLANRLGISRRTLGRWEQKGTYMSQV